MGSMQQIIMGLSCLAAAFFFGHYVHNKPAPESPMQTVSVETDANGFLTLPNTSTSDRTFNTNVSSLEDGIAHSERVGSLSQRESNSIAQPGNGLVGSFANPAAPQNNVRSEADIRGESFDRPGNLAASGFNNTPETLNSASQQSAKKPVMPNFEELASRFRNSPLELPPINNTQRNVGQHDHAGHQSHAIHNSERVPQSISRADYSPPELEVRRPPNFSQPLSREQAANQFSQQVDRFEKAIPNTEPMPAFRQPENRLSAEPFPPRRDFGSTENGTPIRQLERNRDTYQDASRQPNGQRFTPGRDINSYFSERSVNELYGASKQASSRTVPSNYFDQATDQTDFGQTVLQRDDNVAVDQNQWRTQQAQTQQAQTQEPERREPAAFETSKLQRWRTETNQAPPEPDYGVASDSNQNGYSNSSDFSAPEFIDPNLRTSPETTSLEQINQQYANQPRGNIQSYNSSLEFEPSRRPNQRLVNPQGARQQSNRRQAARPNYGPNAETTVTPISRSRSSRRRSNTIADQQDIYQTRQGDTLQSIAAQYLGMPDYYLAIYLANRDKLSNPAVVPAGIDLVIPDLN